MHNFKTHTCIWVQYLHCQYFLNLRLTTSYWSDSICSHWGYSHALWWMMHFKKVIGMGNKMLCFKSERLHDILKRYWDWRANAVIEGKMPCFFPSTLPPNHKIFPGRKKPLCFHDTELLFANHLNAFKVQQNSGFVPLQWVCQHWLILWSRSEHDGNGLMNGLYDLGGLF